jgi:transposase
VKLARGEPAPAHPPPEGCSNPAISITGSDEPVACGGDSIPGSVPSSVGPDPSKPVHSITGSAGLQSRCSPYLEVLLGKLEDGLSAPRIWQDLVADHGFADGYPSVQRFVRRLCSKTPLPFRRLETPPGEQAQIDFGRGAPVIIPEGEALPAGVKTRRRKTHVFRMVLSCSRQAYSEVLYRQTAENFIRCLENAFHHFGGVPKALVVDNLKAAVLQADGYDPDLNPKIQAFAEHDGTVIPPTRARMPRRKGKIESQIGYVTDNALKGQSFPSLAAQNTHRLEWDAHVADTRIHGTTKPQINKVCLEVERAALGPLPLERLPFGLPPWSPSAPQTPPSFLQSPPLWRKDDERILAIRVAQAAFVRNGSVAGGATSGDLGKPLESRRVPGACPAG